MLGAREQFSSARQKRSVFMVAHAGETNCIATTRQLPISPSFLRQITSPLYRLRSFLSSVPVRIDIFKNVTGAPGAIEGVGEDQY
jgi:hypothetical protein